MIKEIKEIPTGRKASCRDEIRKDIQTALDEQIYSFEFDGEYDYKNLAAYVREEARKIFSGKIRVMYCKLREADTEHKDNRHIRFCFKDYNIIKKCYKVSSRKEEDRIHVYMSYINDEKIMELCREAYKVAVEHAIELEQSIANKKRKGELKC